MPYVFEGGAFEDLLFKGRLKQAAVAAVAAFEGFLAVAEQVLDHVEFLPKPAPVHAGPTASSAPLRGNW